MLRLLNYLLEHHATGLLTLKMSIPQWLYGKLNYLYDRGLKAFYCSYENVQHMES